MPSFLSLVWLCLVGLTATTEGIFWWGSSNKKSVTDRSQHGPVYQQNQPLFTYRAEQGWQPQYTYEGPPVTVALPVALPLSQQMSPVGAVGMKQLSQPVQLVPCLCPISREVQPDLQPQASYVVQQQQQPQQQQQQQQHQQQHQQQQPTPT